MQMGIAILILLASGLSVAQEGPASLENGEPVAFPQGEVDPSIEATSPPSLSYDDFAGPDPVLEGGTPGDSAPLTAGELRLQELREAADPAPMNNEEGLPEEFGIRAFAEAIAALCVVLALIVVVLMGVRRLGMRTPMLAGAGLGQVLGRVYLSPKVSLHYVRTGGRVLVIGVTQESITLVESFDAAAFDALPATPEEGEATVGPLQENAFLSQLREQSDRIRRPAESVEPDDGEIANLRGDIERLQRMLRDATRD